MRKQEQGSVFIETIGSGGGIRTPDTRIMMHRLKAEDQTLSAKKAVKPATEDQGFTGVLSNLRGGHERRARIY